MACRAERFRQAAQEIRTKGWVQGGTGGFGDPTGPCCLTVALRRGRPLDGHEREEEAIGYLMRGVIGPGMISWNDAPGRTVEEVLAALEQAAVEAET